MKFLKLIGGIVLFGAVVAAIILAVSDRLPKTHVVSIEIKNCQFTNSGELKVQKDQNMALNIKSDKAGEIHVHGYELKKTAEAGKSVDFNFRAVQSGIFDIEHHGCPDYHVQLTVLNDDGSEPKREEHEQEEHKEPEPKTHEEEEPHQD